MLDKENAIQDTNDVTNNYLLSLKDVKKVYDGDLQAIFDFNLDVKEGEFVVISGPKGSGKSSLIRLIASLEEITSGKIYLNGEILNEKQSKERIVSLALSSNTLNPRINVYDNIALNLKTSHLSKKEINQRVQEVANTLQIGDCLNQRISSLGAGQKERVSLGRAIVSKPKILLLDDPFSTLDRKLRLQMRSEILKLKEDLNLTVIYATSNPNEAVSLASRLILMKFGHVQQIGTPLEIYSHPKNLFAATFIGYPSMNLFKTVYEKGHLLLQNGIDIPLNQKQIDSHNHFYERKIIKTKENNDSSKPLQKYEAALNSPHEVILGIRPEDLMEGDAFEINVEMIDKYGGFSYVHSDFAGIDLVAKIYSNGLRIGEKISLSFDISKIHLFDPLTEETIF